jgi:hypothetical protein
MRVETNLVRVEITMRVEIITLVSVIFIHSKKSRVDSTRSEVGFVCRRCVSIRSRDLLLCTCQNYTRGNHTLSVKSHSVCGNLTLRVEINFVRVC